MWAGMSLWKGYRENVFSIPPEYYSETKISSYLKKQITANFSFLFMFQIRIFHTEELPEYNSFPRGFHPD